MKAYKPDSLSIPKNPNYIAQCETCRYYITFTGKEKLKDFVSCRWETRPKHAFDKLILYTNCPNCEKQNEKANRKRN